ncbi:MAG: rod shape-determining protein MreC [Candidatus Nealsonbacteria bacterium DGGOD1a]|jgi:Cell shape-determining protein|nr:MAG: rod shape-determining protein MreC [Candidatus Nealsonbacteria bacterium DGGOD1a]
MKISASRGLAAAITIAAVAAVIAIMNVPIINSAVKNTAYFIVKPLQSGAWVAGARVYGFFEPLSRAGALADENARLRRDTVDLSAKNARIGELENENAMLREGLNLELNKDFDLKLARIVGKNIAQDVLIIDKGAKDMVLAGMPVITGQKALVGKISKVYDDFSEVTLVTNKSFSFDVKIGSEGIDGLVRGKGGFSAYVDLVSKGKELKNDMPVVTSALGGIFPAGLVVGSIKEIDKNDIETFQSAELSLAFDINGDIDVFAASGKYPAGFQNGTAAVENQTKK